MDGGDRPDTGRSPPRSGRLVGRHAWRV